MTGRQNVLHLKELCSGRRRGHQKRRGDMEIPESVLVLVDTAVSSNKNQGFDNDYGSLFRPNSERITHWGCLYKSINIDNL